MGQVEGSRNKPLNREERLRMETLIGKGLSDGRIEERPGRPAKTIKRELAERRTGRYSAGERYGAGRGQAGYG